MQLPEQMRTSVFNTLVRSTRNIWKAQKDSSHSYFDHGHMSFNGVIVVLGSPNDGQGRLLKIALERCAQALSEFEKHPDYAVLPTGGWGEHFNTTDKPHGFYLRQELIARGIPESAFLPCVESSNTIEDASKSRPILDACPDLDLILVTSDFHATRARFLFEREFPERQIAISPSTTHLPPDDLARLQDHEQKAMGRLRDQSKTAKKS
jgi:uncharacterized SAM-binding protein YcdF (DUF218 family)